MKPITCFLAFTIITSVLQAQNKSTAIAKGADSIAYNQLLWRNLGPTRGGRSVTSTGIPGEPLHYYMGSTGGGVWETKDAGHSWKNISDGYFKTGSVGAIAVSESDHNVIYVGMGEHPVRGVMTSAGDGMYKSTDAGKTWKHIGLADTRHIAAVRIHPANPDVVWVAAQGAVHGASKDRGIYLSTNGGESWEKVLYVDETTGCADLSLDMTNPRILYAAMWDHLRKPWQMISGGKGSGIYKSTDGGKNWKKLSNGLPDQFGKAGIDVSRANNNRVYAVIEAEGKKGGVYSSNDGGENWQQVNSQRITIARAWYYIEIFADPQQENTVYVLNAPALRSTDGGRNFSVLPTPHGDNHWLWIDPNDNKRMINSNDGGANISFNGGLSWSTQENQPTAQFYRVITDKQIPYNVYGGQQDNTSVIIPSASPFGGVGWQQWQIGPGGESAFIAIDSKNPNRVYGGSYQGNIEVLDRSLMATKDIMAIPNIGLSVTPRLQPLRFNWNAPIVSDPFEAGVIYHGANKVLRSNDGGINWNTISPDLTRNDTLKQGDGGAPYTNEGAGGEVYNTIAYLAASKLKQGEIWTGSDCGLVHLTRDGGKTWTNVTPRNLGETLINSMEVSPHTAGEAWVVSTRYKFNDFSPMVHHTTDFGKTWETQNSGFEPEDFVRVVRQDLNNASILYAGTEHGFYLSRNGGKTWRRFQLNLPLVTVTDLHISPTNDLVAATSGRAFWILDDLSAIQQASVKADALTLLTPQHARRTGWGSRPVAVGANPAEGVYFHYYLPGGPADTGTVSLTIKTLKGDTLATFASKRPETFKAFPGGPPPPAILPTAKGYNRFVYNMRTESLPAVDNTFMAVNYSGSPLVPGHYLATLRRGADSSTVRFTIEPFTQGSSVGLYEEQYNLMSAIDGQIRSMHKQLNAVGSARQQLSNLLPLLKKQPGTDSLIKKADNIDKAIADWQNMLISPNQETFQDIVNFYNRLSAEMLDLKGRIENSAMPQVPSGHKDRWQKLQAEWNIASAAYQEIERNIAEFNAEYRRADHPAILLQ